MTRARELAKLANPEVFSVDSSNNVGVNSTTPDAKLDVVGVISATEYYGDGSNLTGIVAGATLSGSSGTQRVVVTSLTTGSMTASATNSDLTYATSTNTLSATQFSGTLLGNATGLQGTPSITVQDITAEQISIAGTISYEDVSNVNSVGIITAQKGIKVPNYGVVVTGVVTATSFAGNLIGGDATVTDLGTNGHLKEKIKVTAGKLSDNLDINIDNGMVHLFTTTETTTSTPNIVSNAGINTDMSVGEAISVSIVTTAAAGAYSAQLTIDGAAVTENWSGGSVPESGGSSGVDIHTYTIMKTASATYTVLASQTKTSS